MGGHQQKYLCFNGCWCRSKTQWDGISGMVISCTLWSHTSRKRFFSCPTIVVDDLVAMVKDNGRWRGSDNGSGSADRTYIYLCAAGARPT